MIGVRGRNFLADGATGAAMAIAASAAVLVGGYAVAPAGALVGAAGALVAVGRRHGVEAALLAAIVVLLPFDNPSFVYGSYKLRLWYPLLAAYWAIAGWRALAAGKRPGPACDPLAAFGALYFALATLVYIAFDPLDGKLSAAKYLAFGLGLVLAFRRGAASERAAAPTTSILVASAAFVVIWGLLQTILGQAGQLGPFGLNWDRGRPVPSAFFSETTWFGFYALLGLIATMRKVASAEYPRAAHAVAALFAAAALYSSSRNAVLSLALFLAVLAPYAWRSFVGAVRKDPRRAAFVALGIGAILVAGTVLAWGKVGGALEEVADKLLFRDVSGTGRLVAYEWSLRDLLGGFPLGSGFHWDPYEVTSIGTFLGAKSFALLFFVGRIFGLVGAAVFLVSAGVYLVRRAREGRSSVGARYAFATLLVFLFAAEFTPMHQHPIGLVFAGFALAWGARAAVPALRANPPRPARRKGALRSSVAIGALGLAAGAGLAIALYDPPPHTDLESMEATYRISPSAAEPLAAADMELRGMLRTELRNPWTLEAAFRDAGVEVLGEFSLVGIEGAARRKGAIAAQFLFDPEQGSAVKLLGEMAYIVDDLPAGDGFRVAIRLQGGDAGAASLLRKIPGAANELFARRLQQDLLAGDLIPGIGPVEAEALIGLEYLRLDGEPGLVRYHSGELAGWAFIARCGMLGAACALAALWFLRQVRTRDGDSAQDSGRESGHA